MTLKRTIDELIEHKRSLGASFTTDARCLRAFLRVTGDRGLSTVTKRHVEVFLYGDNRRAITSAWFKKYEALGRLFAFATARGYMKHRVLPDTMPAKPPSLPPYIYSLTEIRRLLGVPDEHYGTGSPVAPYTMRTLMVLLWSTGLRLGEATRLAVSDVDLDQAVLTIRETKFYKSRLVPIGERLASVLATYMERHRASWPHAPDGSLLCTTHNAVIRHYNADALFDSLRLEAGVLRFDTPRYQPRLHDLRHTFAVNRLLAWYRDGKDVQRLLPQLSTYLGHVRIEDTEVYLRMIPALLREANMRFERYLKNGS